jgi:tRNA(adenine34) deaminase
MRHTEQRRQLRVKIETLECDLPRDELARINEPLDKIMEFVGDLPGELEIKIIQHPRSQQFHVKAALALPRQTLFTGDWDSYLDTALCRTIRKLRHKAAMYQAEPDHAADAVAERVEQMNREIVAPEDPDGGALGVAASVGDYQNFRNLLATYEDWLRLRVGRWLERYPAAEVELGRRVKIGDLLEEVLLNAFERYDQRSGDVPLHEWLDSLLDPSLQTYFKHPVEERENISLVRTVRDTPPSPTRSPAMTTKKKKWPAAKKKKTATRKWSGKIHTVSTFPPEGTFKKDAKSVARIMASKKVSPKGIGSGIRMITMYINRAGKNLDPKQRHELEEAKHILQAKANGKPKRATRKAARPAAARKKSAKAPQTKKKVAKKKAAKTSTKKAARR